MAAALRLSILRYIRLPVQSLDRFRLESPSRNPFLSCNRFLSSHGEEHLDREEVVERVLAVVKSFPKLDPSKVGTDSHFQKDLGLDSLDNVEIVMALEEEFKLEIPDNEADKIDSCSVAIEYIFHHPMSG
ncbi:acyl carrier protein 1, mitochondrial [Phalaenopsis equestris]|uniref:acyl carrier protein 1, mitochondrial n=1 Tax=Phalaenopsis equestris TaxID=78828 RepID=UPI0009E4BEBF|nr:acyl carrier protein 1, mitochondrial [Phalaenopsis equestris]